MYGLLLSAVVRGLQSKYGDETWQEIRKQIGVHHETFITQKTYSESLMPRISKAVHEITGTPYNEIMYAYGEQFVAFVSDRGYGPILRVLGRHMRDFLNGLDNLHEYLRFSYPRMKPPSFFCENETENGLVLHYRSRRKGYLHYVMGQIKMVGMVYYNTDVDIDVISEETTLDMTHVVMQLNFDNTAFSESDSNGDEMTSSQLTIDSNIFFDVFPFHIVYTQNMVIKSIGAGLGAVMPDILGQSLDEVFNLMRPLVEFRLENILMHSNNVFELASMDPVQRIANDRSVSEEYVDDQLDQMTSIGASSDISSSKCLHLKGQMLFMEEWNAVVFLGTPVMDNLEMMFDTGLYINDLSMHDSSRDLVLAGTQQSAELKMALDQEQQKSTKLEESMRKLDEEMKRTDSLLYQMIPKTVADRLRKGDPSVNTCEVFEQVTILFSDVVGFTRICSQITPMAVVSMLNAMYTKFDLLSEKHRVYKVETIGDAYMVVSGAPTVTKFHALYVCDMAFDMIDTMAELIEPSSGKSMKIRVGIHSGTVVGGVVGVKMPRYCLFGDTVNIASRMENNGEAMKIHISAITRDHVANHGYTVEPRDTPVDIKGHGEMKTHWLTGKSDDASHTGTHQVSKLDNRKDSVLKLPTTPSVAVTEAIENPNAPTEDLDTSKLYKPVVGMDHAKARKQTIDQDMNVINGIKSRKSTAGKINGERPEKGVEKDNGGGMDNKPAANSSVCRIL